PIWWRRARFSSWRAAREQKIEDKVAKSDAREMSIGGQNYGKQYNSHPLRHFEVFERHNGFDSLLYSIRAFSHAGARSLSPGGMGADRMREPNPARYGPRPAFTIRKTALTARKRRESVSERRSALSNADPHSASPHRHPPPEGENHSEKFQARLLN